MKKFIFTFCAIAFTSFLVQAQDTPSVDDATITVKKIEKKTKASYTDSYSADDDTKKIVVKKRIGPNCEKNEGLSGLGGFMFLI